MWLKNLVYQESSAGRRNESHVSIAYFWYPNHSSILFVLLLDAQEVFDFVVYIDHYLFYAMVNFSLNQLTSHDDSAVASDCVLYWCHSTLSIYLSIAQENFVYDFGLAVVMYWEVIVLKFELLSLSVHQVFVVLLIRIPKNEKKTSNSKKTRTENVKNIKFYLFSHQVVPSVSTAPNQPNLMAHDG